MRMAKPRLRIVHLVRAPIGGIFRHIIDLANAQAAAGHEVGIVCTSIEGGAFEDGLIAAIAPRLTLGAARFPMRRQVSPSDPCRARPHAGTLYGPPTWCTATARKAAPTAA